MDAIKELGELLEEASLTPYVHKPGCDMKDCCCSPKIIARYTTVCKDKYGKYYDLRYEHPSWEEKKKGLSVCIVVNAFTCTIEEAARLTKRKKNVSNNTGPTDGSSVPLVDTSPRSLPEEDIKWEEKYCWDQYDQWKFKQEIDRPKKETPGWRKKYEMLLVAVKKYYEHKDSVLESDPEDTDEKLRNLIEPE